MGLLWTTGARLRPKCGHTRAAPTCIPAGAAAASHPIVVASVPPEICSRLLPSCDARVRAGCKVKPPCCASLESQHMFLPSQTPARPTADIVVQRRSRAAF